MQPTEIGRNVTLVRYEPGDKDKPGASVEYQGIVLGAQRVNNSPFPHLHIAFLDPKRSGVLNGANWRHAFDRHFAVPHETQIKNEPFYYRFDTDELQAEKDHLQETVHGLEMQLAALAPKPSAEDLDATAADEKAKEATATQQ